MTDHVSGQQSPSRLDPLWLARTFQARRRKEEILAACLVVQLRPDISSPSHRQPNYPPQTPTKQQQHCSCRKELGQHNTEYFRQDGESILPVTRRRICSRPRSTGLHVWALASPTRDALVVDQDLARDDEGGVPQIYPRRLGALDS